MINLPYRIYTGRKEIIMYEPKWKLGEDMYEDDTIFNQITFNDIILALHCGERVIDKKAVKRVAKEILEERMTDFENILANNINEIIAEAKKGRN